VGLFRQLLDKPYVADKTWEDVAGNSKEFAGVDLVAEGIVEYPSPLPAVEEACYFGCT